MESIIKVPLFPLKTTKYQIHNRYKYYECVYQGSPGRASRPLLGWRRRVRWQGRPCRAGSAAGTWGCSPPTPRPSSRGSRSGSCTAAPVRFIYIVQQHLWGLCKAAPMRFMKSSACEVHVQQHLWGLCKAAPVRFMYSSTYEVHVKPRLWGSCTAHLWGL